MKFYYLLLFFFLSLKAFSQSDLDVDKESFFRIGGKVGINLNKIHGESLKQGYGYNYLFGAFMQFNFSYRFGVQPEFNLTQASSHFTNDATEISDDLFSDGSQKSNKFNYLKIPLLLNVNVGTSKRVKLQIGPEIGTLLGRAEDSIKNSYYLYGKRNLSMLGGLWIQIPFVNLGARYELGLTNVKSADNSEKWKTQAFTFFAGFTF